MKTELWPIDQVIPYAGNPRKIPQSAIDKVATSIEQYGWRQPIVVDRMESSSSDMSDGWLARSSA